MTAPKSVVLRSPFSVAPRFTSADADALAGALKALADPTRLRILALIAEHGSVTVTGLMPQLKLSQAAVSHHLAVMRQAGLVKDDKAGKVGAVNHRTLDIDACHRLAKLIDPQGGRS